MPGGRPRILLAVEPRLLAHALAVVLSELDADVVRVPADRAAPGADVAIVTGDRAVTGDALTILIDGGAGRETVVKVDEATVVVADLQSLVELLRRFCHAQGAAPSVDELLAGLSG